LVEQTVLVGGREVREHAAFESDDARGQVLNNLLLGGGGVGDTGDVLSARVDSVTESLVLCG